MRAWLTLLPCASFEDDTGLILEHHVCCAGSIRPLRDTLFPVGYERGPLEASLAVAAALAAAALAAAFTACTIATAVRGWRQQRMLYSRADAASDAEDTCWKVGRSCSDPVRPQCRAGQTQRGQIALPCLFKLYAPCTRSSVELGTQPLLDRSSTAHTWLSCLVLLRDAGSCGADSIHLFFSTSTHTHLAQSFA